MSVNSGFGLSRKRIPIGFGSIKREPPQPTSMNLDVKAPPLNHEFFVGTYEALVRSVDPCTYGWWQLAYSILHHIRSSDKDSFVTANTLHKWLLAKFNEQRTGPVVFGVDDDEKCYNCLRQYVVGWHGPMGEVRLRLRETPLDISQADDKRLKVLLKPVPNKLTFPIPEYGWHREDIHLPFPGALGQRHDGQRIQKWRMKVYESVLLASPMYGVEGNQLSGLLLNVDEGGGAEEPTDQDAADHKVIRDDRLARKIQSIAHDIMTVTMVSEPNQCPSLCVVRCRFDIGGGKFSLGDKLLNHLSDIDKDCHQGCDLLSVYKAATATARMPKEITTVDVDAFLELERKEKADWERQPHREHVAGSRPKAPEEILRLGKLGLLGKVSVMRPAGSGWSRDQNNRRDSSRRGGFASKHEDESDEKASCSSRKW